MAVEYFQSALFANEMDAAWLNNVRFDKEQSLSEIEKAQARTNIGAATFGSLLQILAHYDTLEALQANGEEKAGNAYSVGTVVPYKLYIFDGATESWMDYGYIRSQDINARCVQNVPIAKSSWEQDAAVLAGYTYKARFTLTDSTVDSFPIVIFESKQALSGNFAPMSFAFAGYLEIFAKTIPTEDINIATATVIVGGGVGKGITNATGGITAGSIGADSLADGSVTTAKIADGSVARSKLAPGALYSPLIYLNNETARTVSAAEIGGTFYGNNNKDYVITINKTSTIPISAEFACFCRFETMKITFGSNTKVYIAGENELTAPTLSISDKSEMVAIKKIDSYDDNDYYLVTGPVEVVT